MGSEPAHADDAETGGPRAGHVMPTGLANSIFDAAPFGIRVWSPDGRTRFANPAYGAMLGLDADVLHTIDIASIVHSDDIDNDARELDRALRGEQLAWRLERRMRHAHGYHIWVLTECRAITTKDGRVVGVVEQIADITDLKHREADFVRNATHDTLTGLPNRSLFTDRLQSALARSARRPSSVAVLFCDLDRFKYVNDTYGHTAGDELLVHIADRLQRAMRSGDTVARFGGDEFVVLCEDLADQHDIDNVAKRIMHALDTPFHLSSGSVVIGASIGVAIADDHIYDPEDVIANADVALFHAKDEGRARVVTYSPEMHADTRGRLAAQRELQAAIDSGAIEPYFQPIVDVATGEIRGFEAFARWHHPELGVVAASEFMPLAEETGLVVDIGARMLDAACAHAAHWSEQTDSGSAPYVAVTCSARQLVLPDLPDVIASTIDRHGIDPERVCIQITESALTYDAELAVERLELLRASGVRIAIDDFGVDHSSIAYLRRFPVDLVKIDTSFIVDLGADSGGSTIVAAVIALAHALGLSVVAEGVETIEQLTALYTLGCDQAQGYLFSPAVPAAEAADLLGRILGMA